MKKRNKLMILTILAIGVNAGCFTAISAYFISSDEVQNTMTVGHNTISILEEFIPPDKLQPGVVIAKKVNIENTGETPCAVRVSVELSDQGMEQIAELDMDNEHWVRNQDGYYYYTGILDTGGITYPLFNQITISEAATQSELKDFDVMIYAESRNAEKENDYTEINWD